MDHFIALYNCDLKSYPNFVRSDDNNIISWLESQNTAKAMTYLAMYHINPNDFVNFNHYINKAIELDPEFMPAYLTWTLFTTIDDDKDRDKYINYAEKILASGLYKEHYEDIYEGLVCYYEEKGDLINCARYAAKLMQISYTSIYIIKTQGPDITIEMAEKIFLDNDLVCFSLIKKLLQENQKLKKENETIKAFPGGPDYEKALSDFNNIRDNHIKID